MVEEVPQEEAPHQVVKPQTAPMLAPSRLPHLYMQLMKDIAEDPPAGKESHCSSLTVLE
jgi:hypothetical protein